MGPREGRAESVMGGVKQKGRTLVPIAPGHNTRRAGTAAGGTWWLVEPHALARSHRAAAENGGVGEDERREDQELRIRVIDSRDVMKNQRLLLKIAKSSMLEEVPSCGSSSSRECFHVTLLIFTTVYLVTRCNKRTVHGRKCVSLRVANALRPRV